MDRHFPSPPMIYFVLIGIPSFIFPSTNKKHGFIFKEAKAFFIASRLAWNMFILSITLLSTMPIPIRHFFLISLKTSSLSLTVRRFESSTRFLKFLFLTMTAPATTGPARGPRPASSMPQLKVAPSVKEVSNSLRARSRLALSAFFFLDEFFFLLNLCSSAYFFSEIIKFSAPGFALFYQLYPVNVR